MDIRDRIKSLRRVKASDLKPHPLNWRTHTDAQRSALQGILAEVGYVGALIGRETPDGIEVLDGHLRAETTPDMKVPVLIVELTDEEAAKVLLTFDPLGAMAEADDAVLKELLAEVKTDDAALQAMLEDLAESAGIFDADEVGMPELPSGDREPFQQMTFTLADEQAADVKRALDAAKKAGPFDGSPNENSNGNALARIVEVYLGTS